MPDSLGVKTAPPRERDSIRKDTYLLRKQLGLDKTPYFDIVRFLEFVLPQIDPDFLLEPVQDKEIIGRLAEILPAENVIRVKQSVYDAATHGNGWARMILAHELGHYYYHNCSSVGYATLAPGERLPNKFNPEKQADIFAAELLAPMNLIKGKSESAIAREFGISIGAAKVQLKNVKWQCESKVRNKKKKRPNKKFDR